MNKQRALVTERWRQMAAAYVVLLLLLASTWLTFLHVRDISRARNQARFDRIVARYQAEVERGVGRCVDQMHNIRALFDASVSVEPDEWNAYLGSIRARQLELGIRSITWLEQVNDRDRADFLKRHGTQTNAAFAIYPEGERPVHYPVVYVSRFDGRPSIASGFDHASRPERLQVIESAIAQNKALATERSALGGFSGAPSESGVLLYLPVYRKGLPLQTADQRRAAAIGLVNMTVLPEKLLAALFENQAMPEADVQVYDGREAQRDRLLYDAVAASATGAQPPYSRQVRFAFLNREWLLVFSALPDFASGAAYSSQRLVLAGGLVLSLLAFGITRIQVRARTRAEQDEAALATETELLSITLDAIADGVITVNAGGKIVSLNKAGEKLTGWQEEEADRLPLREVFRVINEQTRTPVENPVGMALQTGRITEADKPAWLVSRHGSERLTSSTAAPIHDKTGLVIGAVLVFRDITEKRKTEAEMLREGKLETLSLLAGGIAHDFNNILTGIIGNISLARMSAHSTEQMLERLIGVERSAMRARDLTQQLLTFAKGGSPLRQRTELPGLVKEVCQFALHGSNVQCEYALPQDTWAVELDEGQFRQTLNLLIINAMQSMPEGGRMEVKLENAELADGFLPPLAAGKYVNISIRDHGCGIEPQHLPRMFEPYFTTKKGGSGLGLAMAYSIVRKHGGQIKVESTIGSGTVVQIYLPASFVPAPPPPVMVGQTQFLGHGRVLIMDDETEVLTIASAMLRTCGYEVETAKDGAQTIERYLAAKGAGRGFDAVILDLTVANGMGGREAIRRLKQLDASIKAIVSSGYSFDPVMANYREYGFCGIIPKPYRIEDLSRVLKEALSGKPEEQPPAGKPA